MRELFRDVEGADGHGGVLTMAEFQSKLGSPLMQEYFRAIDLDVSEAQHLFRLLDLEDTGAINLDEFLGGCVRLHGPAKALDLALLIHETQRLTHSFHAHVRMMESHAPKAHKKRRPGRGQDTLNTKHSGAFWMEDYLHSNGSHVSVASSDKVLRRKSDNDMRQSRAASDWAMPRAPPPLLGRPWAMDLTHAGGDSDEEAHTAFSDEEAFQNINLMRMGKSHTKGLGTMDLSTVVRPAGRASRRAAVNTGDACSTTSV